MLGCDATHVKALGPLLAAFLLLKLDAGPVHFHGDSRIV